MKRFTRVLGVGLPLVMVLVLAVALLPASTPTAEADVGTLEFETIPLPKFGADGGYVLTPGTDVGPIAAGPGGSVVFASANISASSNINELLKSTDGGYSWTLLTDFRTEADAKVDTTSIVAIEASPEYGTDTTLFVATQKFVYQSFDGGTDFTATAAGWTVGEDITDMDITLDSGSQLSLIVSTTADGNAGEVYVYCPATTGMSWQAQLIGARNVLAAAFSPNFASDEGIFAVTFDGTDTKIQAAFGATATGGGWGADIGDGTFLNRDGDPIADTERARMAFPDDFDVDSLISNIVFVGLTDDDTGTTDEEGDVFQVILETKASSTVVDLNVRGAVGLQPTATNIWSIDVSGSAEAANILVGTDFWSSDNYWLSYYSTDSGVNWSSAGEKSPTGAATGLGTPADGAQTNVVMAPDFATSGVAYAATQGDETSALSRTADGGKSWNQISLIDYSNTTNYYTLNDFDPNILFGSTPTAYLVTVATKTANTPFAGFSWLTRGAVWKTTNGGATWERILSYANPSVSDQVGAIKPTGTDTIFACDYVAGKLWRSSDGGATFPKVVTTKITYLSVCNVKDETTIHTADFTGAIWTTTNLGQPWVEPDESTVDAPIWEISTRGDIWLVPTSSGKVFISTDGGVTITDTVGVTDLSAAYGYVSVAFDNDYDTNHFVYASTPWAGIWRIELNVEDPDSTEWKQIDTGAANIAAGAPSVGAYVAFQLGGPTLYCYDYATVNTTANTGGLWLSRNPAADIEGLSPPLFEKTQTGLTTGMAMGYAGYAVYPNTIFMRDMSVAGTANYYAQVYAFADDVNQVSINAPDRVSEGGEFAVTVDINEVENLDACNYDVSFDSAVLELDSVTSGDIGGTVIPVDIWNELSPGTFTIVQNVPGTAGVSGSGHLAVLHFHVIGSIGDSSNIGLSNGMLSSNLAEEILAIWIGDSIEVAVIPGDANGDAVVNAVDITKTERIIAGLIPSTPGADCNGDGTVNALDITCIERLIMGMAQYQNAQYGFSVRYPIDWIEQEEADIFELQAPSGVTGLWVSVYGAAEADNISAVLSGHPETYVDLDILNVYGTTLADGTPAAYAEFNATVADWPMHLLAIGLIHGDYWVMIVMWNIDEFAPYDEALFTEIAHTLTVY